MLRIVFINDFHSNIPKSIDFLENFYNINHKTVKIDLGDFIEGSPFYNLFQGKPELKIMPNLFQIIIPGNHGFEEYCRLKRKNNCEIINANIFKNNKPFFKEYLIIRKNGLKVAFIGIMSLDAFEAIEKNKRKKFDIKEPKYILDKIIKKIKEKRNVDYIIVLSHSGIKYDLVLSKKVKNINLFLSSHCHSRVKKLTNKNMILLKAKEMGEEYGYVELSKNKKIKYNFISVKNKKNEFTEKFFIFFNPLLEEYKRKMSKEIMLVSKEFSNKYNNRKKIIKLIGQKIIDDKKGDICIINLPCLRDVFYEGVVTFEDMYRSIPFDNYLVRFKINKEKFNIIYNNISNDIKKTFCVKSRIKKKQNLIIVTTTFIFENYFFEKDITYKKMILLRDYIKQII